MNKEEFILELKKINIELSEDKLDKLDKYKDILLEYNKHTNLTAIKEDNLVYLKHFYDSLTIANDLKSGKVLDIGTGAGFPGMVLAIVRDDLKFVLLDSNNKKIKFLEYLCTKLGINNVTLIHDRAENYIRNNVAAFDYVTSRAVARLRILSELAIPALKVGGSFIAMKGILDDELVEAMTTIEILNSSIGSRKKFKLPIELSNRENIIITKNGDTDNEYPRSYDKILKKPLVKIK
ncbi:MAG: 16S rRNA (guanine(527)-N(7))-methyltransferase RsmG [Firmicutes bacterium]|nr:16S rRNA (guanine(527)-N(7))-methyltransferase RsmG [Bacillota bacterium]